MSDVSIQKIKNLLNKSDWNERDYMHFILEVSASSARFGTILLEELEKNVVIRGNTHVMLILPFGSGKTTSIADIENSVTIKDMTYPSVVGTISKNGEFVKSYLVEAAGKVLVFDEFQRVDMKTKEAFNDILEEPRIVERSIGFKVNRPYRKKGKFYSVFVKGNNLRIYSRFSCITCGLTPFAGNPRMPRRDKLIEESFFSRFLPFSMFPTIDYYEELTLGKKIIKVNPVFKEMSFVMEKDEYLKYNRFFWKDIRKYPFMAYLERVGKVGHIIRFFGDTVRIGAFLASLEDRNEITFEDCALVFDKVCKFSLPSFITQELSEKDYFVYTNLGILSREEIAERLGVSVFSVDNSISKLKSFGLYIK